MVMVIIVANRKKRLKCINFFLLVVQNIGEYVICAPGKSSLATGTSNYYSFRETKIQHQVLEKQT